jgi:hypothetical protein
MRMMGKAKQLCRPAGHQEHMSEKTKAGHKLRVVSQTSLREDLKGASKVGQNISMAGQGYSKEGCWVSELKGHAALVQ